MNVILNTKVIGNRLKDLRGAKTQLEIADAIGVTKMAISQYESGDRIPRDEIKIKLAKYFDKSVEEIFYI